MVSHGITRLYIYIYTHVIYLYIICHIPYAMCHIHISPSSISTPFQLAIFTTRSHCLPRPTNSALNSLSPGHEFLGDGDTPGLKTALLDCSNRHYACLYKQFDTYNNPWARFIDESHSCDNAITLSFSLSLSLKTWLDFQIPIVSSLIYHHLFLATYIYT